MNYKIFIQIFYLNIKYFFYNPKNEISFAQFFSEHYTYYFLLTLIEKNNIIYTKYGKLYPQLYEIQESGKELSNELIYNNNSSKKYTYEEKVKKLHEVIDKFLDKEDLINMKKYHEYLSMATGLLIGITNKENLNNKEKEDLISTNSFLCQLKTVFNLISNKGEQKYLMKNKIKQNLFDIINSKKEETLLLFNILIFIVQNKEINISRILLNLAGLNNVFEKTQLNAKTFKNIDINNSINEINKLDSKISFTKDIFTFNNYYFSILDFAFQVDKKNNILESISIMLTKDIYLLPITYQILYQNIINLSVAENYKISTEISDKFRKNIESKYKSILFCTFSLYNNDPKNRENSYDLLYDQWKIYKDMNNKILFQTIKKNILSKVDILYLKKNIDNNADYTQGFEIVNLNNLNINKNDNTEILSSSKRENICFETNLLIFMLVYDLKTIFKKRKEDNNIDIQKKLMKNKFPLDLSSYDFQVGETYELEKYNSNEIYRHQIHYKILTNDKNKEKPFMKCEIFFYKSFIYFGLINQEDFNKILIFKKIDIKLIEVSKDYNQKEIDNCLQIKLDDGNDEFILIKFENKNIRNSFKDLINKKIMTSTNDERLLFSQFFEELTIKYRINENKDNKEDDF